MNLKVSSQIGVNIISNRYWFNSANQVLQSASLSLWVAITLERGKMKLILLPVNTLDVLDILSLGGKFQVPSTAKLLETVAEFQHHIVDLTKAIPTAEGPCVFGSGMPGPQS